MKSAAVKSGYKENNDSVVILDSCDTEWTKEPSGDEQLDRDSVVANDVHLEGVANTVFNIFKKVCVNSYLVEYFHNVCIC